MLVGGIGRVALAGVGVALVLVCGRRGFNLETDLADFLDSESLDLVLLTTFEYDLVIDLGSLKVLGTGSLMVVDREYWLVLEEGRSLGVDAGWSSTPK